MICQSDLKTILRNAKCVSEYMNLPLSDIRSLMIDGSTILSAEQAKAKGFITNIVEPNIPQNADISSIGNA